MTLEDLKSKYANDSRLAELIDQFNVVGSKSSISGLVGSAKALVSGSVLEKTGGTHLFILNDKEEAAYFHNDLESLFEKKKNILFFPDSYRQPYQVEGTDNANVVLRAEVLNKVAKRAKNLAIITYPDAIVEKVVTKQHLAKNTMDIVEGAEYSIDFINELLIEYEFEKVDFVYEPGQFSVRGGLVDVFSFANDYPYRIEFFGDEVDSIRSFDPSDQLSVKKHARISIVPNVQDKLLKEARQTILEFVPSTTHVWIKSVEGTLAKLEKDYEKARYAYDKLDSPLNHLTPSELYFSKANFERSLKEFTVVEFGLKKHYKADLEISFNQIPQPNFNKNFELLAQNLNDNNKIGFSNFILSANAKQIERIYNIFEDKDQKVKFDPIPVALHEGFLDNDLKFACYTDHQIFQRYHKFRLKEGFQKTKESFTLKELSSLKKGDYVTHADHGVGQFSGLEKIDVNGKEQEAIRLIYGGSDILYVSIHSLHRITRFTGKDGKEPKLNKLGSPAWNNAKKKTKAKVKTVAYDLIKLYAKRKASKGFAYTPDTYLQNELEASFIYEDTPDQNTATIAIKKDMEMDAPMDRLVCGDVGFGKTELAIRAAFKAVTDSKQVAILVPTTILALQHYKNIKERLKDFPCTVDYINRFKSTKRQNETFKKLAEGKVDILVGTHKIVGDKVKFKDLGLLIIDEEQKFGVGVKDKLKTIKENVDTLTLTATPIPRTLQFSLMNARDLSVLKTAPPNRHPVHTELVGLNEETLRDAITYETQRGGQVYFVHNRIQNIHEVAGMIQRLCPDVRIAIGHGQMDGKKLEEIMLDFIEGMYDVLIATTIIESGIDIPNANTMIVNNAQNFGLSDLHQLRGRVGRSNKKAFCYLITPALHTLSSDSRKRLTTLTEFSDLGSGFNIAMRDLDIRGAGDLLGANQSGFISDIGFDMYQKILAEAVDELKENEFKELFKDQPKEFVKDCQIETDMEILIPDDYVNEIAERLMLYRELDNVEDMQALKEYESNMIDRFGAIPTSVQSLFDTIELRWLCKDIGFEKVILKQGKFIGYFVAKQDSPYYESPKFTRVLSYIQKYPTASEMSEKNNKLRLIYTDVESVRKAIDLLSVIVA